jgi:hypothetical protein
MSTVGPATQLVISVDDADVLVALVEPLAYQLAGMVVTVTTRAGEQIEMTIDEANLRPVRRHLCGSTHWQSGEPAPERGFLAVPWEQIARMHIW